MQPINTAKKRFKCSKCNMEFGYKTNINTHIKRKTSCIEGDNSTPICITTLFTNCQFCNEQIKTETSVDFMKKHLEICQKKNTITTTTINYNTTINNYIQLNSYERPALSHLKFSKNLLMSRQQILKQVNFNPDIPENHNIIFDPETAMYKVYKNNSYFDTVTYEKLLPLLDFPLDKAQEYMIDNSGMIGKELEALRNEVDASYSELEKANKRQYGQIIKDNSKIALKTRNYIDSLKQIDDKSEEEDSF